jgi:hypothetical protein
MARSDADNDDLGVDELTAFGRPLVEAGASWIVFGWPVRLDRLAEAAGALRAA